jgi:hypothetical protein
MRGGTSINRRENSTDDELTADQAGDLNGSAQH